MGDIKPDIWNLNNSTGKKGVLILWDMTYWCNYKCSYCYQGLWLKIFHSKHKRRKMNPVNRFIREPWHTKERILKGKLPYNHAFDNYSVKEWGVAFNKLDNHNCSLILEGGEILLDYINFIEFIKEIIDKEFIKNITIITNASVSLSPTNEKLLSSSKICFMLSFHPEHISLEKFYRKVNHLKNVGWNIALVNFIFSPEKMGLFEESVKHFSKIGIKVNPNPDLRFSFTGRDDKKRMETAAYLMDYLNEYDLGYKTGQVSPKGKLCRYPMITLRLFPDGEMIGHSCFTKKKRHNLFSDSFNPDNILAKKPVPCPCKQCYSLHKYPFLCESNDRYLDTFNFYKRYSETALLAP